MHYIQVDKYSFICLELKRTDEEVYFLLCCRTCDSRKEAECLLANIEIRRLDTLVGGIR